MKKMELMHRHIKVKQMTKIYESLLKLQSELPGSKVNMQGIGAANTYARRTGLMQLLGITSYDQNDDDANQFDPDVEKYFKYKNKLENSSKEQLKNNIDSIKNTINELNDVNPKWGTELNAILNMRIN